MKRHLFGLAVAVSLVCLPALARPAGADNTAFVDALQSMMAELRPHSRRDAQLIRAEYRSFETFRHRVDLEVAMMHDELAMLPEHTAPLNIILRLDGASPIAEKDLAHQEKYLGARPGALGLLMEIAAQVKSGPIEVTSLVRHLDYQRDLAGTNGNARTDVPTHAMGIAFDIALVNTPLSTAYELRDVLSYMRDAGRLYFIGESQQLVFHVVPTRAWLSYYEALHLASTTAPAAPMPEGPSLLDLLDLEPPPAPPTWGLPFWYW